MGAWEESGVEEEGRERAAEMKIWDVAKDARELPRFDFVAKFVAMNTRTKRQREAVNGMYVKHTAKGWVYGFSSLPSPSAPPQKDAAKFVDAIRRTDLGFYTRMGEDFRVSVHEARDPYRTPSGGALYGRSLQQYATEVAHLLHAKGYTRARARVATIRHVRDVKRAWSMGQPPCAASDRIVFEETRGFSGAAMRLRDPRRRGRYRPRHSHHVRSCKRCGWRRDPHRRAADAAAYAAAVRHVLEGMLGYRAHPRAASEKAYELMARHARHVSHGFASGAPARETAAAILRFAGYGSRRDPVTKESVLEAFKRSGETRHTKFIDAAYKAGNWHMTKSEFRARVLALNSAPAASTASTAQAQQITKPTATNIDRVARETISFGRWKAFVDDVYRARDWGMTRADFDRHLVALHRGGQIRLARADLTPAMDLDKVRASEVPYMNAMFHFVDTERDPKRRGKFERCVRAVKKATGYRRKTTGGTNPWAVCHASLKKATGVRRQATGKRTA